MTELEKRIGKIIHSRTLPGGDINQVYHIETQKGNFIVKKNDTPPPQMFEKEAIGLRKLAEHGLPVPEVYLYSKDFLLLEYLPPGPHRPDQAGRALGRLHAQDQDFFGFESDNYIGSLTQQNSPGQNWVDFFWEKRISYQLKLLSKRTIYPPDQEKWERLKEKLPGLVPLCKPSLIHGDLWSGNLYWGVDKPYFIDPAVYYADPMIELAFSELFGGFGESFYRAYSKEKSIPKEYPHLKKLYQIYPLLVHANLFGGGYYSAAVRNAEFYLM